MSKTRIRGVSFDFGMTLALPICSADQIVANVLGEAGKKTSLSQVQQHAPASLHARFFERLPDGEAQAKIEGDSA